MDCRFLSVAANAAVAIAVGQVEKDFGMTSWVSWDGMHGDAVGAGHASIYAGSIKTLHQHRPSARTAERDKILSLANQSACRTIFPTMRPPWLQPADRLAPHARGTTHANVVCGSERLLVPLKATADQQ